MLDESNYLYVSKLIEILQKSDKDNVVWIQDNMICICHNDSTFKDRLFNEDTQSYRYPEIALLT